jgi:hypothetical protein
MSPLLLATSMMRPIASALAATVSSNLAGSPLTRIVMITDMDPPLLVGLREATDPIPGFETCECVGNRSHDRRPQVRRPGRPVDQSCCVALRGIIGARRARTVSMISPRGEFIPLADAPRATAVKALL